MVILPVPLCGSNLDPTPCPGLSPAIAAQSPAKAAYPALAGDKPYLAGDMPYLAGGKAAEAGHRFHVCSF